MITIEDVLLLELKGDDSVLSILVGCVAIVWQSDHQEEMNASIVVANYEPIIMVSLVWEL